MSHLNFLLVVRSAWWCSQLLISRGVLGKKGKRSILYILSKTSREIEQWQSFQSWEFMIQLKRNKINLIKRQKLGRAGRYEMQQNMERVRSTSEEKWVKFELQVIFYQSETNSVNINLAQVFKWASFSKQGLGPRAYSRKKISCLSSEWHDALLWLHLQTAN